MIAAKEATFAGSTIGKECRVPWTIAQTEFEIVSTGDYGCVGFLL
jgi:hypothetical protein